MGNLLDDLLRGNTAAIADPAQVFPKRSVVRFDENFLIEDDGDEIKVGIGPVTASMPDPVGSLDELRALVTDDESEVTQGQTRYIIGEPVPWSYDASSGAGFADDGATIVRPNDKSVGENGRWYPVTSAPVIPTIAALRLAVSGVHQISQVKSFSSIGDDGGGTFVLDPSDTTSADNGGTVIVAGSRRWKRKDRQRITAAHFGAKNDFVEMTAQYGANIVGMTAGSPAITGHVFPARYVGKKCLVRGAGPGGTDLKTTIATSTTLATSAGTTVIGADIMYGTDNTAALSSICAFRQNGGTVFLDPAGGYLTDGTINLNGMSGVVVDGARGRAYRIGATICNIAASGRAVTLGSAHGCVLRSLRVTNANQQNTDMVVDLTPVNPGIDADTGYVLLHGVIIDGNPARSSRAGVGLGGTIMCVIGTQSAPVEVIRCGSGVFRYSGYANETAVWMGCQECGNADNTAWLVQDPGDGWVINLISEPGFGRPTRGIGFTKDEETQLPIQAAYGGTWRVWGGDGSVAGGVAIEVFGGGIRVGGHFEDSGAGSVGIKCYAGSAGIHLTGGSVFRTPKGVEFITDAPFSNVTNGFTADACDFQSCPVPFTNVFTGAVIGFHDVNGRVETGFQNVFTGGTSLYGLVRSNAGMQLVGWGLFPPQSGWYVGFLGQYPAHTIVAAGLAALGAGTLKPDSEGGGSSGDIEGTSSLFIVPAGTFKAKYSVAGAWRDKLEINGNGVKFGGGNAYITKSLKGSKTWDPPSVSAGAITTTTVTVTGAVVGDGAVVSFTGSGLVAGAIFNGVATAADTVTVTLVNNTGGALDLGSGTLTAAVIQWS